jgi:hypothetical protein
MPQKILVEFTVQISKNARSVATIYLRNRNARHHLICLPIQEYCQAAETF